MDKHKVSYKILLIEDNLGDVTLIKEYLEEQFSSPVITVARNYKEALIVLNDIHQSFDILLLDLSLPDKSGEPLINELITHQKIDS